jgi:integrase
VPLYKLGTHHTWTEAELDAFEARWPLGTRERLAYDLLLYTGQRVGDVVRMRRSDIVQGAVVVVQDKTAEPLKIQIHPALARALKAGPSNGIYLIGDATGRPIQRRGLSSLIVKAAKLAGLPRKCVAHGLRKAILRRLAEHGSSTKQIQAVSGHRTLTEIERYTRQADQRKLAKSAIGRLPDRGG